MLPNHGKSLTYKLINWTAEELDGPKLNKGTKQYVKLIYYLMQILTTISLPVIWIASIEWI